MNPELFGQLRRRVRDNLEKRKVLVYYPGIGGGEEALDLFSPFDVLDADEVYGIDLFPYADGHNLNGHDPERVDFHTRYKDTLDALRRIRRKVQPVRVVETDLQWEAEFCLDGRPRKIIVSKIPTDASKFLPPKPFPVIYSRRTIGVVPRLPDEVFNNAEVIAFIGEMPIDAIEVDERAQRMGYRKVDDGSFSLRVTLLTKRRKD